MNSEWQDAKTVIDSDELPNLPIEELEEIRAYWFKLWNFVDGSLLNKTAYDRVTYSIESINQSWGWDTSKVTNMNAMFQNCTSLASMDLTGWEIT